MALNLGELVAGIRADDSGWRHGLQEAQIRLAGFTRMADGSLRDMHNNVVEQSDAMGQTLGARIGRGARTAVTELRKVGPAAAGVAAGIPAVAAATAALGGLAAGAAAAGLAVKAFSLAAGPQLELMKESATAADSLAKAQEEEARKAALAAKLKKEGSDLATKAEKAYQASRLKTKDAEAAYQQQTKGMPAATAEAALAQARLKTAHEEWSASLAGSTMPVFTKGMETLRGLLPMLTPFVDAAATSFGNLLDKVAAGVKSAGFKEWADDMAAASGPALTDFLTIIGNLARGFGSLLQAFLPASAGVTGGLVSMTGAFATWASSLKGSAGFDQFLALAREGGTLLGTLARAALSVLIAFGPLIGITTMLALKLAEIVNALPPEVMNGLAMGIAAIVIAMKLWALWGGLVATATKIWAAATWLMNTALLANPITWIILAIVALIAIVVLIATKTTWFQQLWDKAWAQTKVIVTAAVKGILIAVAWLKSLPGKIATWFGQAKDWAVKKMLQLVAWLVGLPKRAYNAVSNLGAQLRTAANLGFQRFRDAAATKVASFITWVRGMPGRIAAGIGSLGSLLYNKGMDVVTGLWRGIQSMGGWIRGQLMSWARSMIPGPIAKALGIASPSKVTTEQGRWIARGLIAGMTGSSKQVRSASQKLADIVRDRLAPGKRRSTALSRINTDTRALLRLAGKETTLAARMKTASKAYADLIKARDKLAKDVREGVLSGANITQNDSGGPVTGQSILSGLIGDVGQAQTFAKNLAALKKKGVSADLIAQIAQAGVAGGSAAAQALATADKGTIRQINAQQQLLKTAAEQAGSVAGNSMYGTGIQAAKGLISGLKSQQSAIEKQMLSIAQGMSKAIRKALGIKSPSRVMANQVGRHIPAGIVAGIRSGQSAVDKTMSGLVSAPRPGQSGISAGGGLSGHRSGQGVTTVRIELSGPEEVKRLIRTIVKTDGRGSVQTAFGR
ncbi:phage tail protein [Streptomyces altiplanensis]